MDWLFIFLNGIFFGPKRRCCGKMGWMSLYSRLRRIPEGEKESLIGRIRERRWDIDIEPRFFIDPVNRGSSISYALAMISVGELEEVIKRIVWVVLFFWNPN